MQLIFYNFVKKNINLSIFTLKLHLYLKVMIVIENQLKDDLRLNRTKETRFTLSFNHEGQKDISELKGI